LFELKKQINQKINLKDKVSSFIKCIVYEN
jgi:hypothetical protein